MSLIVISAILSSIAIIIFIATVINLLFEGEFFNISLSDIFEKFTTRKRKIKHCLMCNTIITPSDYKYSIFDSDETKNEPILFDEYCESNICVNCEEALKTNGLLNIPKSRSQGKYIKNTWGCYGRKFKNDHDLYKFMFKMDSLLESTPKDEYGKLYTNNKYFDNKIKFVKELSSNHSDFISREEIEGLLSNYFGCEPVCHCCKEPIYTSRLHNIKMNEIHSDTSLDAIDKYGKLYQLELKESEIDKPTYLIDKTSNKIKPYCTCCLHQMMLNNKYSVKALEPVIYYDNIDQIKALL